VFRESWGYAERPFDEEYQRWMHILDREPDHDPAPFWFVAVDGAEIAGLCLCDQCDGGDAETAWVHAVGVRTAWRGQGLVLALLHHSFGMLYQQGRRRISLEVDAQSPTGATHLYDRAGMHVERRYDLYEKEVRLEERALRNLADAAANRHRRGDWIPWEQKRESHGAVLSA
jgi:ribosomal protein S18 acetylase RimI-like enzyme